MAASVTRSGDSSESLYYCLDSSLPGWTLCFLLALNCPVRYELFWVGTLDLSEVFLGMYWTSDIPSAALISLRIFPVPTPWSTVLYEDAELVDIYISSILASVAINLYRIFWSSAEVQSISTYHQLARDCVTAFHTEAHCQSDHASIGLGGSILAYSHWLWGEAATAA